MVGLGFDSHHPLHITPIGATIHSDRRPAVPTVSQWVASAVV